MNILTRLILISGVLFYSSASGQTSLDFTMFVNPFIGTGGHGHTYPGASVPFGMVQLSPDTRLDGWDGCSGYHDSDTVIYGFSHTHLSGTGCSDYGDILFMPVTGKVALDHYGFSSSFKHSKESASPGYYQVVLEKGPVNVELTTTPRCGLHRYTFPENEKKNIVLDLIHRDKVLESNFRIVNDSEIEGMRISQAWASRQILYFSAKFSTPFISYAIKNGDVINSSLKVVSGHSLQAIFSFPGTTQGKILVKIGISAVSSESARKNLEQEIPGWDFESIRNDAQKSWNKELGKIEVEGGTPEQMIVFYTSLYHALLNPNLYMDTDGNYRGRDLKIHQADGFDYYTVFSLWDTYRAAHPLFTIIDQKRTNDFIQTFIRQYEEGGILPVWELSGNETGCMIGYHAVPVIVDAFMKGIRNFDAGKAFLAMKHSAEQEHLGLKYYKTMGFIPGNEEGESVSKTLEYSYDDWCIAQMAKSLGKQADYETYIQRGQYYKNIFDPGSGFMRAKMNNIWFSPFDPAEVNFNYTEANAWQYSFYVPQDMSGLMMLHGGKEKFAQKLDDMFHANSATTGRDQSDISGLIGQYAHGNEPSHHMAYLYNYALQPWKTQALVHQICHDLYSNSRDGLCGNEDCGQMSAWYVLSSMGFYPVTPGSNLYDIGSPLFPKVTIHLENGKKFVISANNISEKNFYIQSAKLNGFSLLASRFSHEDIMNGGELDFEMGPQPNIAWGLDEKDAPVSSISDYLITPVPSIEKGKKAFMDSTVVNFSKPLLTDGKIYYTIDGSEPTLSSSVYNQPLVIKNSLTLRAFAYKEGFPKSFTISTEFTKMPENRKIVLNTKYSGQYAAGGDEALIDFIRGGENFRTGSWQGYEGVDLDAVIDLGNEQQVEKVSAGFLQDQDSWIFMPVNVKFFTSVDGKSYNEIGSVNNNVPENTNETKVKEFAINLKPINTRYIKVFAKNRGICPSWHVGSGKKAWIFADEITIE